MTIVLAASDVNTGFSWLDGWMAGEHLGDLGETLVVDGIFSDGQASPRGCRIRSVDRDGNQSAKLYSGGALAIFSLDDLAHLPSLRFILARHIEKRNPGYYVDRELHLFDAIVRDSRGIATAVEIARPPKDRELLKVYRRKGEPTLLALYEREEEIEALRWAVCRLYWQLASDAREFDTLERWTRRLEKIAVEVEELQCVLVGMLACNLAEVEDGDLWDEVVGTAGDHGGTLKAAADRLRKQVSHKMEIDK